MAVRDFSCTSALVLLTVFLACRDGALGYPTGAPTQACSTLTPGHRTSSGQSILPQVYPSPYVIKVQPKKYVPGGTITVTIETKTNFMFQGLLLQVRSGSSPVGTWQTPSSDYKLLQCSNPDDSLTHANSNPKSGSGITGSSFTWNVPSTLTGVVRIMGTIALQKELFWTGHDVSILAASSQTPGAGCASEPCVNGLCFQSAQSSSSYFCNCDSAFEGSNCNIKINSPYCVDGTVCGFGQCYQSSVRPGRYTCFCDTGYALPDCMNKVTTPPPTQAPIPACLFGPCMNGGTCQDVAGNLYYCACTSQYEGQNCDIVVVTTPPPTQAPIPACLFGPCMNGGTCQDVAGNLYYCACTSQYEGQNCDIVACVEGMTCKNGGSCSASSEKTCECASGFIGDDCGTVVDACVEGMTCKNGGSCSASSEKTCECASGFIGDDCGTETTNYCASKPCKNGGTCISFKNFTCSCNSGYVGDVCEPTDSFCATNSCKNGGTCESSIGQFECRCKPGYSGLTCNSVTNTGGPGGPTGLPLEIWWIVLIALIGLLLIIIAVAVCYTIISSGQSDETRIVGNGKRYP